MNKDILCQDYFDHRMCGVVSMFVVSRKLCLLRIEVLHFYLGWIFNEEERNKILLRYHLTGREGNYNGEVSSFRDSFSLPII